MNSWLGGFESILKCMVTGNFNWFLHTMLFYYIRYVLEKQIGEGKMEKTMMKMMMMMMMMMMVMIVNKYICTMRMYLN